MPRCRTTPQPACCSRQPDLLLWGVPAEGCLPWAGALASLTAPSSRTALQSWGRCAAGPPPSWGAVSMLRCAVRDQGSGIRSRNRCQHASAACRLQPVLWQSEQARSVRPADLANARRLGPHAGNSAVKKKTVDNVILTLWSCRCWGLGKSGYTSHQGLREGSVPFRPGSILVWLVLLQDVGDQAHMGLRCVCCSQQYDTQG